MSYKEAIAKKKLCKKCNAEKDITAFYMRSEGPWPRSHCKACSYSKSLAWNRCHKEKVCQSQITQYQKMKKLVYDNYGRVCRCCGETETAFLCIDHINGGGSKHRKAIGGFQYFYRWLIKNNFPTDFQVLCHNCNFAKSIYGKCPHTKKEC